MVQRPLSADSHVTEPAYLYGKYIDPAFRDRAPFLQYDEKIGDFMTIPGHPTKIPFGLMAAAGKDPKTMKTAGGVRFTELHRGGWDPVQRIKDQDLDGLAGEIIYPTVGMVICTHSDAEFKRACFRAYNQWLAEEFVSFAPRRLFGLGQLMIDENIDRVVKDAREIRDMGLKGFMIPDAPEGVEARDFDDSVYDPVWEALSDLDLPISFHIQTGRQNQLGQNPRGGSRNKLFTSLMNTLRTNQDLVSLFTFCGIFERHPRLKMVSAEADAGWLPHFMYRMDHNYKYHRYWSRAPELQKLPSEYVRDQVYLTFQDDLTAFQSKEMLNVNRLLWASDFPHSDSTWPNSIKTLDEQTGATLDEDERERVTRTNLAELYHLDPVA